MAERRSPIIALDAVGKRYGAKQVLDDISFAVPPGACVALLGHNGAGKTTLIKLMLGLTRPSSGRLSVLDLDPGDRSAVALRGQIGFLPENVSFHQALTGRETAHFYARLLGVPRAAADALLERVGLADAAGGRVRTYSKGMRQRLGLAQALLGAPRLLLLDEPTTGLDPALRRQFYALVAEHRRAGATALICSHSLSEIEAHADLIGILQRGRLVAFGTLDALRRQAGLPSLIRVTAAPGQAAELARQIGEAAQLTYVNDRTFDLACLDGEKMQVIRRLAALGEPVHDLDIAPPQLEQIYAHFTDREAQP